jgi:type IV secretory pathway VirB4 component
MMEFRKLAAHERAGTTYARHLGHISDGVGLMRDGSVFAVIEVGGFPHEMAGDEAVNARHAVRAALPTKTSGSSSTWCATTTLPASPARRQPSTPRPTAPSCCATTAAPAYAT